MGRSNLEFCIEPASSKLNYRIKPMGFTKLPFAVILEVCNYLDVETLIVVADLNKDMRNLSLSYKSYWLPHVLQEGLVLPLPSRPWPSFSPQELSLASRRAVFRERNISSEHPKLYSSTRISWPFSGMKVPVDGSGTSISHRPLDVSWIPSFHSNGEWYFALSKDFTLRILHIRTAALVLEERLYISNGTPFLPPSTYSLEPLDDLEVNVSVVTPYNFEDQNTSEEQYRAVLSTYRITLDPKLITASIEMVARISLTVLPRLFDISGDYAVLVEDDEDWEWEGFGPVYVVDWRTGQHVIIPQLLHSFAISGFPNYFISLGVDTDNNIELQLVSLPLQKKSAGKLEGLDDKDGDDSENTEFVLAGSVPIQSDSKHIRLDYTDAFVLICHLYTGPTTNNIRVWLRGPSIEQSSIYNVFNVPVDFSKPPEQWLKVRESLPSDEGDRPQVPQYDVQHRRISEKDNVAQYVVPGTSGTRFFWWQEDTPYKNSDGTVDLSRRALLLYSADAESLLPLPKRPTPEEDLDDVASDKIRYEQSAAYTAREMECPFSCDFPPPANSGDSDDSDEDEEEDRECVYTLITDDWSGTVLVTLTCGDLLVLRYGHP